MIAYEKKPFQWSFQTFKLPVKSETDYRRYTFALLLTYVVTVSLYVRTAISMEIVEVYMMADVSKSFIISC